jgi:hypothetical protein
MINQRIGITDATRAFIADAVAHGYNADWLSLNIVQLSLCDVENKSLHQASLRFANGKFKNAYWSVLKEGEETPQQGWASNLSELQGRIGLAKAVAG